ncbi:anaerobic C4-dicarboxylate transport [Vibrionales bacterium SWAT-3]|nr:anaerobic C4-dicarboxylate transport [Vibrionales bacterium SWAT-3]
MIIVTERGKGYRFAGQVTQDKEGALRKIQAQAKQDSQQTLEVVPKEEAAQETTTPAKKSSNLLTLFGVFTLVAVLSHYLFSYLDRNTLAENLAGEHFISCKIETDEFTFNELYNVTLYEYKDRKIIIDNSGNSLSFPSEFKGVTCE